jgi:hypothetical protein
MPLRTAITSTRAASVLDYRSKMLMRATAVKDRPERAYTLLDQTAFDRVKYRLKPIMGAKLLVDRMKVVSQSWQSDVQLF